MDSIESAPNLVEAKPESMAWLWLSFGQVWLFVSAYSLLVIGIRDALFLTVILGSVIGWVYLVARRMWRLRTEWDDEGMALMPLKGRWVKPLRLLWSEVVEVRPLALRPGGWVIRLDRPRKFWTFRPRPRKVIIQPALVRDPRFMEALWAHVPEERFREPSKGRWRERVRNLLPYVVLLGCGAVVWSLLRFREGGEVSYFVITITAFVGFWAGAMAVIFFYGESTLGGLIGGCLAAFIFVEHRIILLAVLAGRNDVVAGSLGLIAGLLLGAALLMLIAGRKGRPRLALFYYAAGIAGLLIGVWAFGGVSGMKVAEGSLPMLGDTWTPSSDGFVIVEKDDRDLSDTPTTLRWYSADLQPGNELALPVNPRQIVVGEECAVCRLSYEDHYELYLLPRRSGNARLLDSGEALWWMTAAPDRSEVFYRFEEMPPEMWRVYNLKDNSTREVRLPEGLKAGKQDEAEERFAVSGSGLMNIVSVFDRKRGKTLRLNRMSGMTMSLRVRPSPDGRRLLYTGVEWRPEGGLFVWERSGEEILRFKSAVYELDVE
jgi:hypothetical protein